MASKTQTEILQYLKTLPRCWAIKVIAANERGCPDILCCYKGRFLGIEVKSGGDRLSGIQKEQLSIIREAGGATLKAEDVEDVKQFINIIVNHF